MPPRGNKEAVQIEIDEPVVGYRPTRLGVLRIEDVDSRIRLAGIRTHESATQARDAPLPWGSGLGTLRVLPRKPRLNPPGFEPPGSDMLCVGAYGRMGMAVAPDPGLLHTRRPRAIRDWGVILGPHPAEDNHPPTLEGEHRSA